jgi:hypothetical protein
MTMKTLKLLTLSVALCFGVATGASAAAMSKADYEASMDAIAAKYKADKAACKSLSGNAEDICSEEAEGREKIAKAELEAQYKPADDSQYKVRMAKAEAAFEVAKERCDDFSGNAKDVCVKEAQAAFVSAKENAKVADTAAGARATAQEKTDNANADAREENAAARKDAASAKRDADYATAKEKCDAFAGDAKSSCLADAKSRFGD